MKSRLQLLASFPAHRETTYPLINTGALARCKNALAIPQVFQHFSARFPRLAVAELTTGLFLLTINCAAATVHYVDLNSTNATPPYTNWTTAARNIQDAVDAAVAGDEVVVTNGTYFAGVTVFNPVSLRSVNGPQVTTIDGGGLIRCAVLFEGAILSGFTLTNGFASNYYGSYLGRGGAGVLCLGTNPAASIAVVSNCVITGNRVFANRYSGIRIMNGGGVFGGTLNCCKLIDNSVGVSSVMQGACTAAGGGAFGSALNNCTLVGNSANATNADLIYAFDTANASGGAALCTLNDCTLAGNSAYADISPPGSVNASGGAVNCTMNDCINFGNQNENTCEDCVSPGSLNGNNWYGDPQFVDYAGGDLRLQSNSPCINAGSNAYAPTGSDLDGNPRIVGGTVDIGAYEYQSFSLINFNVISNQAGFSITGQSNQVVTLETSPDLQNWSPLATNTLNGHPFPFSDPTPATLPLRFYRAQGQ